MHCLIRLMNVWRFKPGERNKRGKKETGNWPESKKEKQQRELGLSNFSSSACRPREICFCRDEGAAGTTSPPLPPPKKNLHRLSLYIIRKKEARKNVFAYPVEYFHGCEPISAFDLFVSEFAVDVLRSNANFVEPVIAFTWKLFSHKHRCFTSYLKWN